MYNLGSIRRYIADKFIIYLDDNKLEDNSLIESIILNTRLLTNDKLEYNNLIEIFRKRLDVIYNGNSAISKALNSNAFINKNTDDIMLKLISDRTYQEEVRAYSRDVSKIITSLFMFNTSNKTYNGLEITDRSREIEITYGTALNDIVNEAYTLMMLATRFYNPKVTPNDIINRDMRENLKYDKKIRENNYIKIFNLVRMLLIASENKPNTNYNKLIREKKSPITHKDYNSCGDKVVMNDLLYAGKYGMAAYEYQECFDKTINCNGAFESLLGLYDNALNDLFNKEHIDKNTIKKIIYTVYEYYGARYMSLQKSNAFSKEELELYKNKFKKSVDVVCNEFNITLSPFEMSVKKSNEETLEQINYTKNGYYKLNEVKENFEVQDQVSDLTKKKVKQLLKQCDLN